VRATREEAMKRAILIGMWIVGGVGVLLGAAAAYLLTLLSPDNVRAQVEKAVEAATGRDLSIQGEVGVALWPVFGVSAKDVSLANVAGGVAPVLAQAREVKVGVAIWPLLDREIEVHELVIEGPTLNLEVDAKGAPNWVFTPPPAAVPPPQGPTAPAPAAPKLTVHTVRVIDGAVSYANAQSQQRYSVSALTLDSALRGWDQPTTVRGHGVFNEEAVKVEAEIGRAGVLLDGAETPLVFLLNSTPLVARFDGTAIAASGGLRGAIEASGPSLRNLSRWVGAHLGDGSMLKAFRVVGALTRTEARASFENATITLDGIDARGDFSLESLASRGARKPLLSGRLEVKGANLTPYLTVARPVAGQPASAEAEPPRVEIAALDVKRTGWDETPLDFSGLNAIDASLEITVSAPLRIQTMQIDQLQTDLTLQDGLLLASLNRMQMYGGSGDGRVTINVREPQMQIGAELTINGVRAEQFLQAFMGYDQLNAAAVVRFKVRASGQSQDALLRSLSGDGGFAFSNGALSGVDFGGVSRTVGNLLDGKLIGPQARTPFNGFSANFQINRGIAATRDFTLESSEMRLTAIGAIDVANQALELRLTPASIVGRRRDGSASTGLPLPFVAKGPWNKLEFSADLIGAARGGVERRVCEVFRQAPAGVRPSGC
jgi:AsmA protein